MLKQSMKALMVFLLAIGLLAACAPNNVVQEEGKIVIQIKQPKDATQPLYLPTASTNILIRLWNDTQNIVKTFPISTTGTNTMEIRLPAGNYTLEAFSYNSKLFDKEVLTADTVSNVIVNPGEFTSVNLVLERPTFNVEIYTYVNGVKTLTSTIEGGAEYYVDYTVDTKGILFDGNIEVDTYLNGSTSAYNEEITQSKPIRMTAPPVSSTSTLKIQVLLQTKMANYDNFYYLYLPSPTLNELTTQLTLTAPEGGVIVGIE